MREGELAVREGEEWENGGGVESVSVGERVLSHQ